MVGKPNQSIPAAPLHPICGEQFSRVLIDCVELLPKAKSVIAISLQSWVNSRGASSEKH